MEKFSYPKFQNFAQLLKELHSDKLLKEYIAYSRWNDRPCCIHCQQPHFIRIYSRPGFYECSACKIQFSVLQGTIFERSPIPLDIWLWAIFEFCTDLNSSPVSADRHTIQQKTAWKMNMRIRESLWVEMNTKLSGTIHCDEKEVGPDPQGDLRVFHNKRINEKLGLPQTYFMEFFGMLEVGIAKKAVPTKNIDASPGGKLLLFTIDNKSADTLQNLMYFNTDTFNSKFITDAWPGYNNYMYSCERHYILNKNLFGKYDFKKHVRKVNEYSLELATEKAILAGNYMTLTNNPIENVWSKVEKFYKNYYGFSREYAQMYLNEFMFRWNHNHLTNAEKFQILLQRCLNTPIYSGKSKDRKKTALHGKYKRFPKLDGSGRYEWQRLI